MTDTLPITIPDTTLYNAALTNVVRYDESARGRVRLAGRDRASLLQRLTTNDIVQLAVGDGTRTVLVNHNARILDLLTVYALPEHLLVTTNPNQGAAFARFLQSKIFFNDKVSVEDISGSTAEIHLYGPRAADLAHEITALDPQTWSIHHVQAATINGAAVWLSRTLPIGGDGYVIYAERGDMDAVQQALAAVPALNDPTYDVLRIEQGYAAAKRELSTEYIPLETGLLDTVSFSKGCYVGQEIIARMESRQRLAKRLMGLRFGADVAPGSTVQFAGKEAGEVTSVAHSPRFGIIGLGYLRTVAATAGTTVQIGAAISADVIDLPFTLDQIDSH